MKRTRQKDMVIHATSALEGAQDARGTSSDWSGNQGKDSDGKSGPER